MSDIRANWQVEVKKFRNSETISEREYVLEDTYEDDLRYHITEIIEECLEQGIGVIVKAIESHGFESDTNCTHTGREITVSLLKSSEIN